VSELVSEWVWASAFAVLVRSATHRRPHFRHKH
jgi:hypothetical protein